MKSKARPRVVNVVSLGCSKNLVDSERLMRQLSDVGFEVVFEQRPDDDDVCHPDITVVNTCGFIGDAKEQSINEILQWAAAKTEGAPRQLYVMGCLPERYEAELRDAIPEVDEWFGKFNWTSLVSRLVAEVPASVRYDRILTTPRHYTYLKISEGCDRFCAFCAIPLITGRHHSRQIEDIVEETRRYVDRGVKEFNIIAQDLSAYGMDIYGRSALAELIDRLADVEGVEWIRLHYAYPAGFPLDVLDVMARRHNVCKYLDIALQHGSDKVLTAMRRRIDMSQTRELLSTIRERVPGIHLRTTMMTGFPGEDEEAFEEMIRFVEEQRFERLGAFAYCEEEGTYAANNYGDPIPDEVKQHRLSKLMQLQERIAADIATEKIGQSLKVIIDREEDDYYVGRTQWDSPEVDPEVLIHKDQTLLIGEFYMVEIDEALPFELIGHVIATPQEN